MWCVSSTVATYQTLARAPRLQKFDPTGLKAIIVDEAHHAAARSYRRILSHFNSSIQSPNTVKGSKDETVDLAVASPQYNVPIIGFSATFSRHDRLGLDLVFDRIVYHRDFVDMIKEQWLYIPCDPALSHPDMNFGTGYAICDSPAFGQI